MVTGSLGNVSQVVLVVVSVPILWIVASFPLYLASKLIVHERSEFVRALLATFISSIISVLFLVLFSFLFPPFTAIVGFVLILLVLMAVYSVGILKGFALAVLTFVVLLVILFILSVIGLVIPLII
ncbi:MAG: hypothetical protein M1290_07100 [Candidatus Thermoplasmatota archaeon]|jgi:hypothetical protein|nr:hypothetical protein [Candidatus Thermoplasmatota archaeon]MCL5790209.1 hypothetical protein [Candidatus Thermoplasmatota archaeon]